jgi:anhydro-N-acetylmuramic acid kinase
MVAGVMSGTSADGIDVALVRVAGTGWKMRFRLLAHRHMAYPTGVRLAILGMANAPAAPAADLARLNFLLGELYAHAVQRTLRAARLSRLDLVGCHGQTLYHQGEPAHYLGRRIAATWQTGEGAVLAARMGVPVVSDFRPADLAAGGKGAPLVPFLDYLLFRHARRGRVVQNLGGIGTLTAIPADASPEAVTAFDTGPANMVIDAVVEQLYGRKFDSEGRLAARGRVLERVLAEVLELPFFRRRPPKTAGREEFGREFTAAFLTRCGRARKEDVVATATALTARSIGRALAMLERRHGKGAFNDYIVSGGGARNRTLMGQLESEAAARGLRLQSSAELGLPSEAKEAVAFALLAVQTWNRQAGNLPAATGARRPAILGKISYA